jgi:hypothetical protein
MSGIAGVIGRPSRRKDTLGKNMVSTIQFETNDRQPQTTGTGNILDTTWSAPSELNSRSTNLTDKSSSIVVKGSVIIV